MSRKMATLWIITLSVMINRITAASTSNHSEITYVGILYDVKLALFGIIIGALFLFRFGKNYSEVDVTLPSHGLSDFSLTSIIPGRDYLLGLAKSLLAPLAETRVGQYFITLYCPPVASERVLGGFFFGKTMITTAIAFYQVEALPLVLILFFSTIFDSLTGTYQHTLMNYFHRSMFKSRVLRFCQNLGKRFTIDIIRAEVIMLILHGTELLTGSTQSHIFINRLVSSTYYFNAVIIDKLVDMGTINRNFRSNFVIVASTIGGMLCLLDFAQTSFPGWFPQTLIQMIPASVPGPLELLMYFNASVFVIMGGLYLGALSTERFKRIGKHYFAINPFFKVLRFISSITG